MSNIFMFINLAIILIIIAYIIILLRSYQKKKLNIVTNLNSIKRNDQIEDKELNSINKTTKSFLIGKDCFNFKKDNNILDNNKTTIPEKQKFFLSNLISQSTDLMSQILLLEKGQYSLNFSKEVTEMISSGKLKLMDAIGGGKRAIVVDSNGKIVEHAKLANIDNTALTLACSGWKLLSIVTAQKYLADIDNKLSGIKEDIKILDRWAKSEEKGKIIGQYEYLNLILKEIHSISYFDYNFKNYENIIENIIICILQNLEINLIRLNNLNQDILGINEGLSINDFIEHIRKYIEEVHRIYIILFLNFRNLLCALVLKKLLSENYNENNIKEYVFKNYEQIEKIIQTIQKTIDLKIAKMKPSITERMFTKWENTLKHCQYSIDSFNIRNSFNLKELNDLINNIEIQTEKISDLNLPIHIYEKGKFSIEHAICNR